jgi:MFS family permease
VIALFVVTFAISNPFAAFGVFLPVLSDAFGWSRGAISVALSINLAVGGIVGFGLGALADRYGPRLPLTLTVLCAGAGFALASSVRSLWHLYLFVGVMAGIGMSGFYVLSTATVARWFEHRRGIALAVVLTGFNVGFMTGGPIAAALIERFGWRAAYAALGIGLCAVGGLASLLVRFPPAAERPATAARPAAVDGPRSALSRAGAGGMAFRRALRDRRLWFLAAGWLLQGFVLLMISVHVVPYARDRGISLESASLTLTAYGLGAVVGRIVFGTAADRFGAAGTMLACFAIQLVALGPLLVAPSQAALAALVGACGVGFAGADTLFVKAAPDVFGVRALGAIMGVLTLGWRTGAALGPPSAGFMHDATGSYAVPFGAAPVVIVGSFVLFLLAARHAR